MSDNKKSFFNENIAKSDYKKPKQTMTEKMTKSEIRNALQDYKEEKPQNICSGSHIRYFINDNGTLKFRMGGLVKVNAYPKYMMITNGKIDWSVQIKDTIFYVKMSIDDIVGEYKNELLKKEDQLNTLITEHKKALLEIKKLTKELAIYKKNKKT